MKNDDYAINLINILSYIIGAQNLELNDKQIAKLEDHLNKQDKQYERIIDLLEKEALDGRKQRNKNR